MFASVTLLSLLFGVSMMCSAQVAKKSNLPSGKSRPLDQLVKAVDQRGSDTMLSGYVAFIMGVAQNYFEMVPAKAIALQSGPERSKLLCLVRKQQQVTVLMIETLGNDITAFATTPDGVLKRAARGMKYQEFDNIPWNLALKSFESEKKFWLEQTNANENSRKKQ